VTDKVPMSTVKGDWQGLPAQWWGYSKEHGWVVLDRTVPCNAPALGVDLQFLRCRDVKIFPEKRERWIPPHYRFAPNHILDLSPADADAATVELASLKARWPEFERAIQLVHPEKEGRLEAAHLEEEKARKRSATETKKQLAADKA
jgi:hypothetical protein